MWSSISLRRLGHLHDHFVLVQFIPFLVHLPALGDRDTSPQGSHSIAAALDSALQRKADELTSLFGVLAVIAAYVPRHAKARKSIDDAL